MQKVRIPINSFQYGEVSDSLVMRTDTAIYAASAQRVENLLVMAEGSVKKRTGLRHAYKYSLTYDASNPVKSYLASFIFDDNEQYVVSIETLTQIFTGVLSTTCSFINLSGSL